ncbi:MAG: hypothetical protein AB7O96_02875 [Pseudobdellovibrionaceae bacterium]
MSKMIFVVLALFISNFAQGASFSCVGKKPVPSLKFQNIIFSFREVYLEKVDFDYNGIVGNSYPKVPGKLDLEKQTRIFNISMFFYDYSLFEVSQEALSAIREGATEFSAVIKVETSGAAKPSVDPVHCTMN